MKDDCSVKLTRGLLGKAAYYGLNPYDLREDESQNFPFRRLADPPRVPSRPSKRFSQHIMDQAHCHGLSPYDVADDNAEHVDYDVLVDESGEICAEEELYGS